MYWSRPLGEGARYVLRDPGDLDGGGRLGGERPRPFAGRVASFELASRRELRERSVEALRVRLEEREVRALLEDERPAARGPLGDVRGELRRVVGVVPAIDGEHGQVQLGEQVAVVEAALCPDRLQHDLERRLQGDRVDPVDDA